MKAQKARYFRDVLNQRIDDILDTFDETRRNLRDKNERLTETYDIASIEMERNVNLAIREKERKLLYKLREAIDRIDKGTFGICEECKRAISEKRMLANPAATLCIKCKSEKEHELGYKIVAKRNPLYLSRALCL